MKGRTHRLQSMDHHDDWVDGSWTVDCVCGVNFDDGEEMVNCDECGVWVHTRCSRYTKGDELFACDKCKGKGNQNNSEETEVAQLLVELPTKTVRMESSYVAHVPPRRPFRLWTEKPMEERVHVQGVPGGNPSLFGRLPRIFTPELWKCSGYVPKKFKFQYREFPCWDEKKEADRGNGNENEIGNLVNNGAGVLFSLSKERVLGAPLYQKKEIAKEVNKQEDNDMEGRRLQNWVRKDRSLLQPILHSSKRRKDELGMSKDRSGKKKARTLVDEADEKRRVLPSHKSVFRPTSDGKKLEFYEDRGRQSSKSHVQSIRAKHFKDNALQEPISDDNLALCRNNSVAELHSLKASHSDKSGHKITSRTELKEDKTGQQFPATSKSSPKIDNSAALPPENNDSISIDLKEEDCSNAHELEENVAVYARCAKEHPVEGIVGAAEVKASQISQDFKFGKSYRTDQASIKVKNGIPDCNFEGIAIVQSSPLTDKLNTSKVTNAVGGSSQSIDNKVLIVERSSRAVGECCSDHELPTAPLECPEGSETLAISSLESSQVARSVEEKIKLNKNVMNSVVKSSAPSGTALTTKSSFAENAKPPDIQDFNPNIKLRVASDSSASVRKDGAGSDILSDEDVNDLSRKTIKERTKSSVVSTSKVLHQSRMLNNSVSKRATPESKDSVPYSSSKASSVQNNSASSGSGEFAGSLQSQSASHVQQNKSNLQAQSKTNQASVVHPYAPSNPPAGLSDEELALLLHQELNSSPRVPRVPRVRHTGSFTQLASASASSNLTKRTSSSGGKDQSSVFKRKKKETSKDVFSGSRELDDETKRTTKVPPSPDQRSQDSAYAVDASRKEDKNMRLVMTTTTNSGPSSSTEANDQNLPLIRNSPRHLSDDDAGTVRDPPRTLPELLNEIMSKGRRMTYQELCNAVLPHWPNLRKNNGERYAYSSHSQAVLDCLRNRHEWAQLVDRGPKTNSGRRKRKTEAEDSEDNEYSKVDTEGKSLDSQREEFPKGKRQARKRRRLALQGRRIKDVQRRRKADFTDDDSGPLSDSSEGNTSSEDEVEGGGGSSGGREVTASSNELETSQ